jgi:hypothetical protein
MELVQHRIYENLIDEIKLDFDEACNSFITLKYLECQCALLIEHFATNENQFEVEINGIEFMCTVHDNCVEVD